MVFVILWAFFPWKKEYPYSAIALLSLIWGITLYKTLKQREIMKQKTDYVDIYDKVVCFYDFVTNCSQQFVFS